MVRERWSKPIVDPLSPTEEVKFGSSSGTASSLRQQTEWGVAKSSGPRKLHVPQANVMPTKLHRSCTLSPSGDHQRYRDDMNTYRLVK